MLLLWFQSASDAAALPLPLHGLSALWTLGPGERSTWHLPVAVTGDWSMSHTFGFGEPTRGLPNHRAHRSLAHGKVGSYDDLHCSLVPHSAFSRYFSGTSDACTTQCSQSHHSLTSWSSVGDMFLVNEGPACQRLASQSFQITRSDNSVRHQVPRIAVFCVHRLPHPATPCVLRQQRGSNAITEQSSM